MMQQLSLWESVPVAETRKCHVKGCAEPVVGSSLASSDAYVCKKHNELEWAKALAKGKDGYWKTFGKRWLAELSEVARWR